MRNLKNEYSASPVLALFPFEALLNEVSYRFPMRITEVILYQLFDGNNAYYVCPRCQITMEREFMSFCDRCGQCLDWDDYENAKVIYHGKH